MQILLYLAYLITAILAIQVVYLLFFSTMAKIMPKKKYLESDIIRKIRIFIPGYKEDAVIIETAKNAITQNYPSDRFEVVVIADSFSQKTLDVLATLPIKVVEVSFEKSTKGKALHKAIEATSQTSADIVLILDADNLMEHGFLHGVNNAFSSGYKVAQGHRIAKNLNSPFALLDACTEEINNHIFRRGHVAAGLPSALIGSGMAFDYNLFLEVLENIGDTAGEDKEIEFRINKRKIDIAFLDNHYVFDEKVSKNDVFSKQRSRWLSTQVEFFEKYFLIGWVELLKGNVAFFNKVFQTYLLPRVFLVFVLGLWTILSIILSNQIFQVNILLMFLLVLSLLMGIPKKWYNKQLLQAFYQIPGAFVSIIKSVFMIKKARKQFIHTPHGETH